MVKKIIILLLFCDIAYASGAMVTPTDQSLITSDITTNDASTSKHGFAPKAPSDATKFLNGANPPAWAVPASGGITTQTDVSASRTSGTVYQNTTGAPMMISVSASLASVQVITAYTDSANPPTVQVGHSIYNGASACTYNVTFIVLPNNYYSITITGTMSQWVEWN